MAWFKVDDGFYDHPKIENLTMAARGLWLTAGTWCAKHLTDGVISKKRVRQLGGTPAQINGLIDAGLWIETHDDSGAECYAFHDWFDMQPSRKQVHEKREIEQQKKREWRAKRTAQTTDKQDKHENVPKGQDKGQPQGQDEGHFGLSEHPDPTRPDPTRPDPLYIEREGAPEPEPEPEKPKRANARLLPENWEPAEKVKKDLAAQFPTYDLERILRRFHDYWHSQPVGKAKKRDWDRTFRNWVDSETRPPLISERTQPTAPGRLSNAEVARQLQERNAQDQAQQRELSNAEAMQAWLDNDTPKAIGF